MSFTDEQLNYGNSSSISLSKPSRKVKKAAQEQVIKAFEQNTKNVASQIQAQNTATVVREKSLAFERMAKAQGEFMKDAALAYDKVRMADAIAKTHEAEASGYLQTTMMQSAATLKAAGFENAAEVTKEFADVANTFIAPYNSGMSLGEAKDFQIMPPLENSNQHKLTPQNTNYYLKEDNNE